MRIVVAMDSFKGTLTAFDACKIISEAMKPVLSDAVIILKPMADGGEGTARAMIEAGDGRWVARKVMGPLPERNVEAGFAWFGDDTALVEMAAASGLELLTSDQLDPLRATTYGTGQLIAAATEHGARKILLAVGGSATVDGGVGAATALGWKFLDAKGEAVALGGAGLEDIAKIEKPGKPAIVAVEVLCDVNNPLCGENGAAKVYGPQKGATAEMVERLERGLAHLAHIVGAQLGTDIENVPGAGAAGGLAAGAIAFMEGSIVSGIETVMRHSNLQAELKSADWVITGEGSFDRQSLRGKVVSGILTLAKQSGTRVAVLAGQVKIGADEYRKLGIEVALASKPDDLPLADALRDSRELLAAAAERLAQEYLAR
ncbi:MAG: glycerate kinase [Phycisphaerae bacterium]|nr:glycerate kinase [Phycisphaerae bacterium]